MKNNKDNFFTMQLPDQHIILHLSLLNGIGPAKVAHMMHAKPSDVAWSVLYTLRNVSDIMHMFGVTEHIAKKIINGLQDVTLLEQELALIKKHQIQWATIADDTYPTLLRHINAPPTVVYWLGELPHMERAIAMVGSRNANYYGQRMVNVLVPALVEQQWAIVSGGAIGLDTMAHRAALQAKGITIAVLGSGLLQQYPTSNKRLFAEIIATGGTVLSSFPLNETAMPGNFPARNRIIAGLSKGCVVVQAAIQSGARITARFALDQGRDVFAVPGSVDDPLSAGCHALIQEGAKLITGPADILAEYEELNQGPVRAAGQTVTYQKDLAYVDDSVGGRIVQACAQPQSTDDLVQTTGVNLTEVQEKLFELQLAGVVEQDFTGMWIAR